MEKTILAISGKSGLYVMVSRGRSTIIVETLDEQKKRFAVGLHDKITSLNDVSMYTDGDDTPLLTVFNNIKTMQDGKPVDLDPKKASKEQLEDFMAKALPDYDRDRVYQNDIRKLITWYNILVTNGITDFDLPEEQSEEAQEEA
jgi:dephospho-CoA kinase